MSFELNVNPKDRVAGRFIAAVRRALLKAALEEKERSGVSQQSVANKLGVNRSVINRLLRGDANLTLRSVAEIAWALGRTPTFALQEAPKTPHANITATTTRTLASPAASASVATTTRSVRATGAVFRLENT